jgi:hypothetical protein
MKRLSALSLAFALFYAVASPALAQDKSTQPPTTEEQEKEKAEREKNAYRLLDQVIDEAQSLRLTENRVRVQITAADALWDKNQGRARSLFAMAGEGVAELGRSQQPTTGNRRNEAANQERRAFQLRQELVLTAARHDAQLAYQLLATTKPPTPVAQNPNDQRLPRPQFNSEDNLEQTLLGRIAALDPKLAAQNAEQMMEKGQFPRTVGEVISSLYGQDREAAAKLADKTVKRLTAANILTNNEAAILAQSLLTAGVRQPANDVAAVNPFPAGVPRSARGPALEQSAYVELLSSVIDSALKAAPPQATNPRTATAATPQRGRAPGGAPVVTAMAPRPGGPAQPTQEQIEQANARRLIASLMIALPIIEQQLPAKASAVKSKLAEMGAGGIVNLAQQQPFMTLGPNPTADALMQAAATAQPPMQDRLYQQAAYRALEEGNVDRAKQIATDHLPVKSRETVMQRIEFREMAMKADTAPMAEIRLTMGRLQSDGEKIAFLLDMANQAQPVNPKFAAQLLDEARQMTNRRATSYEQIEQQLRVARGFASVDPARSFEVLEPAIGQLNELLSAAAILNGFEINMFRDGEMTMTPGNGLTSTINRVGQELAVLAVNDFERAEVLAGRFQLAEPRIMTRLQIVQGVLSPRQAQGGITFAAGTRLSGNINVPRPE